MKDRVIELASLILVLSGMFFKTVSIVVIAMGGLWLVGKLFPFVAAELGLPQKTTYDFIQPILVNIPAYAKDTLLWIVDFFKNQVLNYVN